MIVQGLRIHNGNHPQLNDKVLTFPDEFAWSCNVTFGLVGLSLLYLGLRRTGRMLRIGGLALFGLSLAKLVLYDLTSLSSVARAFSFIAVGGLFLVGGFFYQRMDVHSPT